MSAPAAAARPVQSTILSQFPSMTPTEVLSWARAMRSREVGTVGTAGTGGTVLVVMPSGYRVLVEVTLRGFGGPAPGRRDGARAPEKVRGLTARGDGEASGWETPSHGGTMRSRAGLFSVQQRLARGSGEIFGKDLQSFPVITRGD